MNVMSQQSMKEGDKVSSYGISQQSTIIPKQSTSVRTLDDILTSKMKDLMQSISKEHFMVISGGDGHRLSKQKFKQYLISKYGPILSEKLNIILTFSAPVDFNEFKNQVEQLLKDRSLLLQIAFDIFDSNNDEKISEMDLFKVLYTLTKLSETARKQFDDKFSQDMYSDVCLITKQFKKNRFVKQLMLMQQNKNDEGHVERMMYFRNLQLLDKNFDRKKEKVLWPIFEFRQQSNSPPGSPNRSLDVKPF